MYDLCENVLEIRYEPNSLFFDKRGELARELKDLLGVAHWKIGQDRVEFFDESEDAERAFLSYNNFGYILKNAKTRDCFQDKMTNFLEQIYSLSYFKTLDSIIRIGTRMRSCKKAKMDFNKLLDLYILKYCGLNPDYKAKLDATLVDIGGNANFKDSIGRFNTVSGPMGEEQLKEFFGIEKGAPRVALYYDIDYFYVPEKEERISEDDVKEKVNAFCKKNSDRSEEFYRSILD